MRVRIVLAGILAGIICLVFLWFQYYLVEPNKIISDWPNAVELALFPDWTSKVILILCALTLFACGWVAARWNWAENWLTSLLSGGGMGLVAGCLIYDFIGVFWFSLKGQEEVLRNFYTPLTETDGIRILLEAIVKTGSFLYLNFIWVVLTSIMFGAFGGFVSALVDVKDFWGKNPRKPQGWLFRLSGYMLTLFGCVNFVVTIAVLSKLSDSAIRSALRLQEEYEIQWSYEYPAGLFLLFGYLTSLFLIFLPLGITWGWIIRAWVIREKPSLLTTLWIIISTAGVSSILLRYLSLQSFFSPPWDIISLAIVFLSGIVIGALTEDDSEGFPYHLSDWIGYGLTFAILGGTQIVMGVLGFSLALTLITIINIPHLMGIGPVDQTPVDQAIMLYQMQNATALAAILASLVIGLGAAGLMSFARTLIGMKDLPLQGN